MKHGKKAAFVTSLVLAGVLAFGVACGSDDGDGNEAGVINTPFAEATVSGTMPPPPENNEANDREDFANTIQAQLEQFQTQIDGLQTEIEAMSGDEQAAAQARLDALNTTLTEIESELASVETLSDDEYETLKSNIEDEVATALTELQKLTDELGI